MEWKRDKPLLNIIKIEVKFSLCSNNQTNVACLLQPRWSDCQWQTWEVELLHDIWWSKRVGQDNRYIRNYTNIWCFRLFLLHVNLLNSYIIKYICYNNLTTVYSWLECSESQLKNIWYVWLACHKWCNN